MQDVGALQATTLKEMEDAAVAADDALADLETSRPTKDSSEPAEGLPQLLIFLPQTHPQEESGHMKSHRRDEALLATEHQGPPRASPTERRHSSACPQLHF
jgi:hypothetical protein